MKRSQDAYTRGLTDASVAGPAQTHDGAAPRGSAAPLEERITALARAIFAKLGSSSPSAFRKDFWASRIMAWSMRHAEFKLNLFRLVDVLPTLKSSAAVMRHVQEYLASPMREIPELRSVKGILSWGLKSPPHSLRAKVAAAIVRRSVREMASLFIAGETPQRALAGLKRVRSQGLAFTVDLLGEYCVSESEAEAYLARYLEAIEILGREVPRWNSAKPIIPHHPGETSPVCISVKLSALYSQCGPLNFSRSVEVLSERLTTIVRKARSITASIYVDAEDSGNNPIIYRVFENVFGSQEFIDLPYPGIVIQAYSKESPLLIESMLRFAKRRGAPIAVRLVKGAYWDQEVATCLQNGWEPPVFRSKQSSDANFESLSRVLLDNSAYCLPAFGSHNIRSLAHACSYAESLGLGRERFELQMLYGMAEPIARAFAGEGYLVRLYVPLGDMIVGMGYLVRRLLENTSNESFLRHTFFEGGDIDTLITAPVMRD